MQVREVMSRPAAVINPATTICDAAKQMRADNIGALPVGENDRLIGMVTDRDIVVRGVAENRAASETTVRQVMSEHVYYCFDDDSIDAVARAMADHQVRRLPVLNHEKRLVGLVALADLGRSAADAGKKALSGISKLSDQPRRGHPKH